MESITCVPANEFSRKEHIKAGLMDDIPIAWETLVPNAFDARVCMKGEWDVWSLDLGCML